MLMRHMHMGISMDIIIAVCFIALLLSSSITRKGVAMRIAYNKGHCQPFLTGGYCIPFVFRGTCQRLSLRESWLRACSQTERAPPYCTKALSPAVAGALPEGEPLECANR